MMSISSCNDMFVYQTNTISGNKTNLTVFNLTVKPAIWEVLSVTLLSEANNREQVEIGCQVLHSVVKEKG